MSADLRELLPGFMFWVLLPLWTLAGIADYLLHRRTKIERTSGRGESWLHVLQAGETGLPVIAGLFFQINSLVLLVMIAAAIAHTLTALWDGTYTVKRRFIPPLEQHVHSHLEYIPLVAVASVVLLHWDAFLGIFAVGNPAGSWSLTLRATPLPREYVATVLLAVFVVQGALLVEEAVRCHRGQRFIGLEGFDSTQTRPQAQRR